MLLFLDFINLYLAICLVVRPGDKERYIDRAVMEKLGEGSRIL